MEVRKLSIEEITEDLLVDFQRYEEVTQAWREENGMLVLKDIFYNEDWDEERKKEVCRGLMETYRKGGCVYGCWDGTFLAGFASLENEPFGGRSQYLPLSMLHVTKEYRGKGLGRILFIQCAEEAKRKGAEKLYISAHSSKNAQGFYNGIGCRKAEEINTRLKELEPYDRQMEYQL